MKQTYSVKAHWDEEAQVFVSESDIKGLHIEAKTITEFEDIMHDLAAELIFANHISAPDMVSRPMKEWVPTIIWRPPVPKLAAA